MKKDTERGLAAAERRLKPTKGGLRVIVISGGLPGPPLYADGGGRTWERASDESFEAFEQRVIADANASGLKSVVIGGLPPDGVDLGTLGEFLSRYDFREVPPEER